ncbi:MAG: hypothetical protein J5I90_18075 [Caldilineales bacterium]|nr:hypothetical protein [Caldilineales bacterium]
MPLADDKIICMVAATQFDSIKSAVYQTFADNPHVGLAYLFGSRVSGGVSTSSDYDFAMLTDESADYLSLLAEINHELVIALDNENIDLISLNHADIELAYAVISQGRLLFQRDLVTLVEFEARVLGLYGDYLPILRMQQAELLQETDHVTRVQRYREALRRTERTLGEIRAAA